MSKVRHTGFYSIIQFVPDSDRQEAVNIGVVVGAIELGMHVVMTERNDRVSRLFGVSTYDDKRLTLAKSGFENRLRALKPSIHALAGFRAQEAGQLQLTPPRPMLVENLDADTIALFDRLVSDPEDRNVVMDSTSQTPVALEEIKVCSWKHVDLMCPCPNCRKVCGPR